LHAAAVAIVEEHHGLVPRTLQALRALPGVGEYTARAVMAFAFELDVAVVDTNVARVLARAIADRPLTPAASQALADSLVEPGRGWAHNQAMLDVGALHCASTPRCVGCPLRSCCRWRRSGVDDDPAKATAHTSRPQASFSGSDREGRGRLLAAALDGPVRSDQLAFVAGWPHDDARTRRVVAAMVDDGLLCESGGSWHVVSTRVCVTT
jgi:A/G-specific adenine glycosylase